MGRASSTGKKYVVTRTDNGKPAYQRHVPVPLRLYLTGEIERADKSRYSVDNKPTIKVALPSGTPDKTNIACAAVHEQVETLFAEARLALANKSEILSISPREHHRILDQIRFEILAADDRIRTHKQDHTGLSEVIQRLLYKAGHAVMPSTRKARQMAQDVAFAEAKRSVVQDDPGLFDVDISEGECEVDDTQKALILGLGSIRNPRGIKLDPETNRALDIKPKDLKVIDGTIAAQLAKKGLPLAREHDDRLQLALDVPRVQVQAYAMVMARRDGGCQLTPRPPE